MSSFESREDKLMTRPMLLLFSVMFERGVSFDYSIVFMDLKKRVNICNSVFLDKSQAVIIP